MASSSTPFSLLLPVAKPRRQCHQQITTGAPILPDRRLLCRSPLSVSASADVTSVEGGQQQLRPSPASLPSRGKDAMAEHIRVLKDAARTRKVPAGDVLSALAAVKRAKGEIDSSRFLETLGGTASPGRTWMLVFTAQGSRLEKGSYFPVTAVQRFDAAGKRIENGVYLGPIGSLTFEGRLSWKNRMLSFIFERVGIKLGPLGPLQVSFGSAGEAREPGTKDPFFIWFYVDEEIAVAQGRGGGTAFWCRCRRVM